MRTQEEMQHEQDLVDACRRNDPGVWRQLLAACEEPLLAAIRNGLRQRHFDPGRAEDLAAELWLRLCDPERDLLGDFEPSRAPLLGYLIGLAQPLIQRPDRDHRSRTRREVSLEQGVPQLLVAFARDAQVELAEFLATLSPKLKAFCLWHLDPANDGKPSPYTDDNYRKLKERLCRKVQVYCNGGNGPGARGSRAGRRRPKRIFGKNFFPDVTKRPPRARYR